MQLFDKCACCFDNCKDLTNHYLFSRSVYMEILQLIAQMVHTITLNWIQFYSVINNLSHEKSVYITNRFNLIYFQ